MAIIKKPAERGPLFGGNAMILFGGFDKVGMRQWQERLRAAEHEIEPTPHHGENAASDGSEFHENVDDEGSADLLSPDAGQPK